TRTAEHAMIPRARVDYVRAGEPITQVLTRMSAGHTRYPVVGASADDLRGVVHLHDLLARDTAAGTAGTVCRPAVIVPTTLPLPDVLARLTEGHEEMALVVDEYGGFAGVVTVEDMAEELVGEIADEHDTAVETQVITRQGEGWVIRGDVHLDEVARTLGHELPEGDYETLAGLVIAEFGGLPTVGDTVAIPLEPDPAELAHVNSPPTRTLIAEVRGIDRHVPASVLVTVRTDHEVSDDE
ncbi:MAG: CBS domain-containing protein, partial [Rhodococcus sp. (in: high G+C Gram-positive bacteria)]|nr:CBS domain-containing protein [Rhodococcus sp. (in: high G+C Gram-positive bacteria)]MDX5454196.1 CBS domain-containing protein [Rhodococcus sp. (in: high G+C Gram-positive bacteria)]